jgi:putative serine protease PepD
VDFSSSPGVEALRSELLEVTPGLRALRLADDPTRCTRWPWRDANRDGDGMCAVTRHLTRLIRQAVGLPVLAAALAGCAGPSAPSAAQGTPSLPSAPPAGVAPSGQAATLQQTFVDVVKRVRPSVVQIQTQEGLGSGIVFDSRGDIITNAHVVGSATTVMVTTADGKSYPGTSVGSFLQDDLAMVRVRSAGSAQLPAATFADSSKLQVGDMVLAVGNPLGLSSSVTNGIVSAVGRTVSEGNGVVLPDAVQTSAPINPGNSGGALVDLSGAVIGIPTLAATDPQLGGGAAPGIGFAIPSSTARDIGTQLATSGRVTSSHRALLGVTLATATDLFGNPIGVIVNSVATGGPADRAGIRPGDIIVSIDGQAVASAESLQEAIAGHQPGDRVSITVHRSDGNHTLTVSLGQATG